MRLPVLAVLAATQWPVPLAAQQSTPLEPVQITATRVAESLTRVPASMTIIRGDELRARGATDLRGALAGVAGVEISPGGDNGPAGSVPAFWGLREFDAFLLVVDGVPSGGAFNPALTTLDLTNVERIEIMRGSAPVLYGATSFIGVIHVIHYPAGLSEQRLWAGVGGATGNAGGFDLGYSSRLGEIGSWSQSVSASLERPTLADEDAGILRGHAMYRSGGDWGSGTGHFDADLTIVNQQPDSPVVRQGAALTTATPLDANHNPGDARFEERRIQFNLGHDTETGWGDWSNVASLAWTHVELKRGFLEDPANPDPNADGWESERDVEDLYLDSHFAKALFPSVSMVYGVDVLVGAAKQMQEAFEYSVDLEGGNPSATTPTKGGEGEGERVFGGVYAQFDWHAGDGLDLLAGLRFNSTQEKREGEQEEDTNGDGVPEEIAATEDETLNRLTGMLGASWRAWNGGADSLTVYADYRSSFKPAAFEFGPEVEAAIPRAETAGSYEAGVKTRLADGRFGVDLAWFYQDFRNVFLLEGNDIRKTRLRGAELEADWQPAQALMLRASYAYHDARFVEASINSGADDVSGNRLELAPDRIASFGFLFNPELGLYTGAMWNYTGDRFLNKRNTAPVPAYNTVDATLGWRFSTFSLALTGSNLSDRRDPVAESEFSEVVAGASSYYRLPARSVMLNLSVPL